MVDDQARAPGVRSVGLAEFDDDVHPGLEVEIVAAEPPRHQDARDARIQHVLRRLLRDGASRLGGVGARGKFRSQRFRAIDDLLPGGCLRGRVHAAILRRSPPAIKGAADVRL